MMIRCLFDGDGVGEDALSTVDDDRGPEIHHKWILLPLLNQPSQPLYIFSYLVEAIECLVMDVGGVLLSIDDGGGEECAAI